MAGWFERSRLLVTRYPKCAKYPLAIVDIDRQKLYLINRLHLSGRYSVSTSRYGIGYIKDSYKTPSGVHKVVDKIGNGEPLYRSFKARQPTDKILSPNRYATISKTDAICTRIVWLGGLEPHINQGGYHDSQGRYIYIHGTIDEKRIGRPSSLGCIRMNNRDIVEVFNVLQRNSLVYITPPRIDNPRIDNP
ncbi:MAG: L,D-transpeptidase [Chromatiales bacterium]|nr:L,D-transpeptidase [Chromatiales bacterium]